MSKRPPSSFFQTPLSEERRERSWEAIAAKLPAPRQRTARSTRMLALAAAMAVLLAVVAMRLAVPSRGAIDGALLETGAGERQTLELGDGSQIVLEPSTKLQLERVSGRAIRLRIANGAVNASVTHLAGRPFTVAAGPVEVHVVGTKFRVETDGDGRHVLVGVTEGRVTLTRSDGQPVPPSLGAGETWTSAAPGPSPSEPATVDASAASTADEAGTKSVAAAPTVSKRFRELWREGRFGAAWAAIPSEELDVLIATAGPQDVFAIAESARMSGHIREAARAFDSFRHRFRSDARAPLAALELGRLRLNELGSPLEAKEAFEDAIALDPTGSFREDSDARLVEALEAAGLDAACVEARDRYLAAHPGGLHERMVKRRCR